MSPKHLVAAFLASLLSTPLSAQSVRAGIEAWQRADYASAAAIWRPLAEKGDADAEFNLGQAYRLGRGVPLSLSMAKGWFQKAADAGHLDAETTLGLLLFQNGDQTEGLKWLRRAAEQGEPRALLVYGTALYNGDGVTQDHLLGYAFVRRAANQGLAPARDTLAQLDAMMSDTDKQKAVLLADVQPKVSPHRPVSDRARPKASPATAKSDNKVRVAQSATIVPARPASPKSPPRIANPRAAALKIAGTAPRGSWRIQLGAFTQRSSAEAHFRQLSGKVALSGRTANYVPAGSVIRLQVGPFESRSAAAAACSAVQSACFPVPVQ